MASLRFQYPETLVVDFSIFGEPVAVDIAPALADFLVVLNTPHELTEW